jgi:hypothetical protein
MIEIAALVWDEWNLKHIARHEVDSTEVREVCESEVEVRVSYRKRLLLLGKTKQGRRLLVVLSPEDRKRKPYLKGEFYVITAFERKEVL